MNTPHIVSLSETLTRKSYGESILIMQKNRSQITILVPLLFALITIISPSIVTAQENLIPAPTGPYQIGTVSLYWKDETRDESYTADTQDKRELMVQFWYPADVMAGATSAPYMSNANAMATAMTSAFARLRIKITLPDDFTQWQSHAFQNVPISDHEVKYPVLIFSHGYGNFLGLYSTQLEEMASQGYIVVGITHTYGSLLTVFPDGRQIPWQDTVHDDTTLRELQELWSADQIFVLDQLEMINKLDVDSLFAGRLDLEHLGIFGHSAGGAAAAQTCYVDSRCQVGIDEDGGVLTKVAEKGLNKPFMFIRTDDFPGNNASLFKQLSGPAYSLAFHGFQHMNLTDIPLWPGTDAVRYAGLFKKLDGRRSTEIKNAYFLAFFNHYLKGEDEPLLNGATPDYPEVFFESRNT